MARTLPPQTQAHEVSPDDEAAGAVVPEGPSAASQGPQRSRRPAVAGAIGGAWAFGVGIALVTCLVMLAWAVSPNSVGDSSTAWRAAGLTWLGAHLVSLQVAGQPLTLLPIGGVLVGLLLTRRSGAWTGRLLPEPSPAEVGWIAIGAAALYGAGGAAVAWLSAAPATFAVPARAALVTGVVAALGTVWGIGREAGLLAAARARLRDATWRTLAAGVAVVVGLLGAGAVLLTASLVAHFATVGATLADLDAGAIGAAGLTLLDAASLPNLAIWAASVIVGPGFTLGSLGSLSAFGGEVGALPALPVLAAIPTTMPGWAPLLLLVPVLLGVLAGRIRWGRDLPTPLGAVTAALGLGVLVAGLLALVMWLASGSLGDGRLADVGPVLLPVVAAGTGLVVLGFLLEAGFQSARLSWELHRAEQRAAALQADRDGIEPAGIELVADVAQADPLPPALGAPGPAQASPSAVGVRGMAAALAGRLVGAGGSSSSPQRARADTADPAAAGVVDVRDAGAEGPDAPVDADEGGQDDSGAPSAPRAVDLRDAPATDTAPGGPVAAEDEGGGAEDEGGRAEPSPGPADESTDEPAAGHADEGEGGEQGDRERGGGGQDRTERDGAHRIQLAGSSAALAEDDTADLPVVVTEAEALPAEVRGTEA
ncbi:MAG TPA: DUF6350 family protein [Candidatus Nanopelagicales bacterium]